MSVNNVKSTVRAQTVDPAAGKRGEELLKKIASAEEDLKKWDNNPDISEEHILEIERIKTLLTAQKAAIEFYITYGDKKTESADGSGTSDASATVVDKLKAWGDSLAEGWSKTPIEDANYKNLYGEDFAGKLIIPASENDSRGLGFKVGLESGVYKIKARTVGKDIVVEVYKKDADGKDVRQIYVIKDGAVKSSPITFFVLSKCEIDCSGVERVVGPKGAVAGINILAGDKGNTIKGSQGDDIIVTGSGNDFVTGNAGEDTIFTGGGDDTVNEWDLGNYINLGDMDKEGNTAIVDKDQKVINAENISYQENTNLPNQSDIFTKNDGWTVKQEKDGYSLQKDPSATDSNIDMKIPPGYKNAFASYDSKTNSLIVYLVSEDGKVVKVKFNGFFDATTKLTRFVIRGNDLDNIIDFHDVKVGGSDTSAPLIRIEGAAGNDVIYGPPAPIDLTREDLEKSTTSQNLTSIADEAVDKSRYTDEDNIPYEAKAENGVITIKKSGKGNKAKDSSLYLTVPEEYSKKSYYYKDAAGNTYYVFVKEDGVKDTIVVKIDKGIDISKIKLLCTSKDTTKTMYYPATPIEIPQPSELFDPKYKNLGGDGNDLFFGNEQYADAETVVDV